MITTLITLALSAHLNEPSLSLLQIQSESFSRQFSGIEVVQLTPLPEKKADTQVYLTAKSALVIDVNSGKVLFAKNIEEKLPIASLTKIMTAVVVLEETQNINAITTVPKEAPQVMGSRVLLRSGEKISYRDLLYSLLIPSGNDAAVALAITTAGSQELFIQKMNEKALALGMKNTHFSNPHGLDDPENYSTANDLAILANYALKKKLIRSIIDISALEIVSADGLTHLLSSTNKLLGIDPEIKGFKTGSTAKSGESLIALAVNEYGNEIITILLSSNDRFAETQYLKEKIWESYVW